MPKITSFPQPRSEIDNIKVELMGLMGNLAWKIKESQKLLNWKRFKITLNQARRLNRIMYQFLNSIGQLDLHHLLEYQKGSGIDEEFDKLRKKAWWHNFSLIEKEMNKTNLPKRRVAIKLDNWQTVEDYLTKQEKERIAKLEKLSPKSRPITILPNFKYRIKTHKK